MSRPIVDPVEKAAVVAAVERLYAGAGPPPRTSHEVHAPDGTLRFKLGGLWIACTVCGHRQPQSRSRQSPEARQAWVDMHLRCPE